MRLDAATMLAGVPEVLRPLLPEVCAALRVKLTAAGEALERGDAPRLRRTAHGLKGASMSFGLEALAREAAVAEEQALAAGLDASVAGEGAGESDLEAVRAALKRFSVLLAALEAAV